MIAVVTGAAGFLGSHLVQALLQAGHQVIGMDNCVTGNRANLLEAERDSRFRFIACDVTEPLPYVEHVDLVLHFASPASPVHYGQMPIETLRVNSIGTMQCCELARAAGARLLYASTSEIYGDPLQHPQHESYWGNVNPRGPRACYDEGKRFGEAAIMAYKTRYGIDARIARIFNTYGPRMRLDDGRVIPTFITQALSGDPLTIFGSGHQTRSLCYVDDLVDVLLRFAMADVTPYDVMNLGSDEEVSVRKIAEIVSSICQVPLHVTHRDIPPDDPTRRRPDVRRAYETLDWRPTTSLREGLERTIAWFRQKTAA